MIRYFNAQISISAFVALVTLLPFFPLHPMATAQDSLEPNEQFIPADQLDTVFERDRRGVMMKRDEFLSLLEKARANAGEADIPIPIITQQAAITVTPGDQQATVLMELKIRQYAEGWQMLHLRAGNLLVEQFEIDGQPALIRRDSADPTALYFAHEKVGEFTARITMSTPLSTLGSDRTAAFQLPLVPAVQLTVTCPAGRHLLVNDLQPDRPTADDAVANYVVPVGNASDVRLRWVVQRKDVEAQTLVFVRTDGQLQVRKETLRWESDSRLSVFGGTINKVVARVPARLEVTSVASTGLESWTLDDDPDHAGYTRITLSFRQPFTNDRLIRIKAVSAVVEGAVVDGAMQKIPTLQFAEVTAHTGRFVVNHEDGLRLLSETGGGVRRVSASELALSTDSSVFDFWLQEFELKVAAKPRDRELFVESSAVLEIDDTTATFHAELVVEPLNAPLFDLLVTLPADWQLTSVEDRRVGPASNASAGPPSAQQGDGGPALRFSQPTERLTWTSTSEPNQILVRPAQPITPGQLMTLVLRMTRTIADPDTEQKLILPVVTAAETTTVGGSYFVKSADDLTVAPLSLTGLTPIAGSGTEQVFQNLGTTVTGDLSIVRKPSRLAGRSVLKTWVDSRQQSLDAEIITDVLSGTIRVLTIRLSESLGPDVRFTVRSVGPVPGIQQTRAIRPVTIIEQSAGTPADGLRPFTLKLDHRFAGSLSLHAFVQQPRTDAAPIVAPIVQVQDAVRQHGVLVFEAAPEQQLSVGREISAIPGLFVADAGLVDAPEVSTGRRVALIYRFVQPGYAFEVNETRYGTNAVPSAVCEQLSNVCTLNNSGSIQRWCEAKIRSSGVQTLRFTLPDAERSFLWSTMLNGEPVEVRRDGGDYLVAVPTNSESQQYVLTVLFESDSRKSGAFGQTDQGPVQFAIDAGKLQAIPIDVLQQTWRVHYPQSSMLVENDGQFRPTSGIDQPGWLASIGQIAWPEMSKLPERLIPLAIFFLVLFVLTVAVIRRRWIGIAAFCLILLIGYLLLLPAVQQSRNAARSTMARNPEGQLELSLQDSVASTSSSAPMMPPGDGGWSEGSIPPGLGGMGSGGMGGALDAGAAAPADRDIGKAFGEAAPPDNFFDPDGVPILNKIPSISRLATDGRAGADKTPATDPFAAQLAPGMAPQSPPIPDAAGGEVSSAAPTTPAFEVASVPKKGSARLSVNVNLDVPADYQVREFVSVADSVHRPSVLSLVVQRQGQIAAIRLVAALVVILLAWRLRSASLLWKLTFAITMLLIAVGLSPILSNAWQSVVDGVALGALVSVAMALATWCCNSCSCPWTWFHRRMVSVG